jgi:hypothetical protein
MMIFFVALCNGRFNGVEFLLKMKGKTVMFVGDSLGRNQWQSLICMLSAAAPHAQTQLVSGDPLSIFTFLVSPKISNVTDVVSIAIMVSDTCHYIQ